MHQQNTEKQLEDLKELQGKLKQMSSEAREKDQLYKQLVRYHTCCDKRLIESNTDIDRRMI